MNQIYSSFKFWNPPNWVAIDPFIPKPLTSLFFFKKNDIKFLFVSFKALTQIK